MSYRDPFTGRFTTRAKYARAVQRITREREKAFRREDERALRRLTEKARKYPPLPTKQRKRRREPEPTDDRARQGLGLPNFSEWEFGSDYKASRRGGHDVSVNVRLTFDKPVSERQARRAMTELLQGGEPSGVTVEAVDWRGSSRNAVWKSGGAEQLDAFLPVLYVGGVEYLRAGAVKPDEL